MNYRPPAPYFWHKFWGLSWWWKGPILGVTALVILGGISAAVGGGGDDKPETVAQVATKDATKQATVQATVKTTTAAATVRPTAAPTPAPTPAPAVPSFGSGTKRVGQDIVPGVYRGNLVGGFCYWARLKGFSGEIADIIANENTNDPEIVEIAPTDAGFNSNRCGDWKQDLTPITSSLTASFQGGTFAVGVDIAPATWAASGGSGCYWARLSGFGGTIDQIIANENPSASAVVTIADTDVGFTTHRCGTWTKQ